MPEQKFLKKINVDGNDYYVLDANAPRKSDLDNYLPKSGSTVTGDLTVNQVLSANKLKVDSIEYQNSTADNVLIQSPDGTIKKRSVDMLFGDIGGCSYSMNDREGVLSFKVRTVDTGGVSYNMDLSSGILGFTTRNT